MEAAPSGILRLMGRLVGVRVKDLFVNYGVLTSRRTSTEHFSFDPENSMARRQNQSPGVSDTEYQVRQVSNN